MRQWKVESSNCVVMPFWQERIMLVCLLQNKDFVDLNAVVIANYEKVMSEQKFFLLDAQRKPIDS